jgi:thioredoxin 1
MKTISLETLSEAQVGVSVLKFYADWCGPCKMMAPIVESLAKSIPNVKFYEVNVDQHRNLSNLFDVTNLPTVVILKEGKVAEKLIGFKAANVLSAAIFKYN